MLYQKTETDKFTASSQACAESKIGTFKFDYQYKIEYEYGFSNLVCMV